MMFARCLIAVAGSLALCASPCLAWGPEGHAIIAAIAEANLDPGVAQRVRDLLSKDTDDHGASTPHAKLDEVASWADAYRATHHDTTQWHFVDIPLNAESFEDARDCHYDESGKAQVAEQTCIVAKLAQFTGVLSDASQSVEKRVEALKYVVHFVGDIHQPLHAETKMDSLGNGDRGGNDLKLTYNGGPTNLHEMWDLGIIERNFGWPKVQPPAYAFDIQATRTVAKDLAAAIAQSDRALWAAPGVATSIRSTARSWADESHRLAGHAYANLPDGSQAIEQAYQSYAWPVIQVQLQKAGVRLRGLLNEALR